MRRSARIIFVSMIFSPVYTVVNRWKIKDINFRHWMLTIFITIYGSILTFESSSDAAAHLRIAEIEYRYMTFTSFWKELIAIMHLEPYYYYQNDFYIHFISYLSSGVLNYPYFLIIVTAFIYGYFYSGALLKTVKFDKNKKYHFFIYLLFGLLLLWRGIESLQAVRFWTAMWIFLYGTICYYENKSLKYLFLIAITPLFHFGFFLVSIPAWIIIVLGSRKYFVIIIFIASFFTNLDQFTLLDELGTNELGQSRVGAYYVEQKSSIQEQMQDAAKRGFSVHKVFSRGGLHYILILTLAFYLIFSRHYLNTMNYQEYSIFSVGLLMYAFSNLTYFLTELSARSKATASLLILIVFFLMIKRGFFSKEYFLDKKVYKYILIVASFLVIPQILFSIALNLYYFSIYNLFFPFIPWFFPQFNISLREVIGYFI